MSIQRVALIFDHVARPETTGFYCRKALGRLVEMEHFLPTELSSIPRNGFDLYLTIDDGLDYRLPAELHPCAWWVIDTHLDRERRLGRAGDFDFLFAAQRDGAEMLRRLGHKHVEWLPLACDPDIHCTFDLEKEFDFCFVGNVFPGPRAQLLQLLQQEFPNHFVGQRYFQDMARTFSAARLVFNRSILNDVNMRVFEGLSSGSLLLTNDLIDNGQDELGLRDGIHLATYKDAEEMLDKAAYYLARPEIRERIAAAGRAEVLVHHTYDHRMKHLLRCVAGLASQAGVYVQSIPQGDGRSSRYFEFERPELADLVPRDAVTILDVGCGAGRLGASLKARQAATVVGIELHPGAAQAARARLDEVYVGDVDALSGQLQAASFDVVICGDVLEHVRHPLETLRRLALLIRAGGCLIASIPNVRHHSVLKSLIAGNWTYEPAGLLDNDHVRFFTRREIEKLLFRAGFTLGTRRLVPGPGFQEWERLGRPGAVHVGSLRIGGLSESEAEEFFVYQYLIQAPLASRPDYGVTSIVIVTHNQLEYTHGCIESILHVTDEPIELVIVDNGSTDGTPDYLATLPNAQVILNADNRGFPTAANQGMRMAKGNHILLLNNDTIVTTGWLTRLLRALYEAPDVGLVGPCSNCVSGEQQIPATYDDLSELDGFAWDWGQAHDGLREPTDRLVGFCLLMRRAIVDYVGLLDERFGVGCFEDDDICRRALASGFRAVIARDAFVDHFGGRTFLATGVDFAALMETNQRLYDQKWARERPAEAIATLPRRPRVLLKGTVATSDAKPLPPPTNWRVRRAATGGLVLERSRPLLSLCMIVRDNAKTIDACLRSIRPWVDEMVIVDTGSTDETPRLAESLGAMVRYFPWCDDFSAARNESIKHARGEWIFWMDSDDTIDESCGRKLRSLAYETTDPALFGFVVQVHCPGQTGTQDTTVVDHVKLFRNRPDLVFEGRIHEQILPAIRRAGGEVRFTDLFVVHSGYDHSPEGQKRKLERDLRILHAEHENNPKHPFTLFNLGMTYCDMKEFEKAGKFLQDSLKHAGVNDSHVRKVYALLVHCESGRGDLSAADRWCEEGLRAFPEDIELRFRKAVTLQELGRPKEAIFIYEDILTSSGERYFTSMDRGIVGYKAHQNLAVVYSDLGNLAKAEDHWRQVTQAAPDYAPGWRGLGATFLRHQKPDLAFQLAKQMQDRPILKADGLCLESDWHLHRGDAVSARRALEQSLEEFSDHVESIRQYCRILFEHGDIGAALPWLRKLADRDPEDGATRHNLAVALLHVGDAPGALDQFRHSLRLRPDALHTILEYARALQRQGDLDAAIAVFRDAVRVDPNHREARDALRQFQPAVRG